jgi:beta-glucosidase-like glycosyl hydrolase
VAFCAVQGSYIPPHLMKALADGAVSRSDLNSALTHMFDVLMRLGQFDTEAEQPLLHAGVADVGNDAHRAIALEAAVQGVVLLTNHNATLPLSAPTKQLTVALVGQTECKLGPYAATPRAEDKATACDLADALNATAAAVTIAKNLSTACDQTTADVIVAVLDTNCLGESHDRGGGAKIAFLCAIFILLVKTITFPRQARDKHRESGGKGCLRRIS